MKKEDIDKLSGLRAMVIGDLMLDEYLWGSVDRISPEAPVPVVRVEQETHTLGGAGNVINNIVAIGASVFPVGTAGTGVAGQLVLDKLKALNIPTTGIISESNRPTTRKTRVIASNQQVLRIDKEVKTQVSKKTFQEIINIIRENLPEMDLVILSDYDKGLVTQELVEEIVAMANTHGVLTLADPKSLDFSKYKNVQVLTPNKKEASLAANMAIEKFEDLISAGEKIIRQAGFEKLLITCGRDGMVLFETGRAPFQIESEARQVFDVSGAGDTVISLLGLGLAAGFSFEDSARIANAAAGIVVAKVGTATASIDELRHALNL